MREVYRCVLHTILFNRAVGWVKPREVECEVLSRTPYARIEDPAIIRAVDKNVDALYALIERAALARTPLTITPTTVHSHPPSPSPSSSHPPTPPLPASLTLSFYESAPSKSWFGPSIQKLYWERWHLPALIHYNKHAVGGGVGGVGWGGGVGGLGGGDGGRGGGGVGVGREALQEERFKLVMMSVVTLMNERRDHLPTVKGGMEGLTYSFECETECAGVGTGGGSGEGGGGGLGGAGNDGGWGLTSMMKKVFKEGPPLLIPK